MTTFQLMMYSVRKTGKSHGNTNFAILICNLIITSLLVWCYGMNYLVIFCSSTLLHVIIETGLSYSRLRKSSVYVFGKELPRYADVLLRAMVEGPAFCVSAFFVADRIMEGNILIAFALPVLVVGFASLYMGLADRKDLKREHDGEKSLTNRRAMTSPRAVMLLSLINTGGLAAIFLMPSPYRMHAFIYVGSYALLVMLFYLINYNLGVRMVEICNEEKNEYVKPGVWMQAAGLTYDSIYEMAFLISPAYWVAYYAGLFHYKTL